MGGPGRTRSRSDTGRGSRLESSSCRGRGRTGWRAGLPSAAKQRWRWQLIRSSACTRRITLHGLIEGLNVRSAEPAGTAALHKLVEQSIPLIRRTREQLQKIAPFVAIRENIRGAQVSYLTCNAG